MRKTILFFFLAVSRLSYSQSQEFSALRIGEIVPNISFNVVNSRDSILHMQDFEEELIILDFWGTWCNSCIRSFPKLDSLQTKFKSRAKIILVNSMSTTGDTKYKVINFLEKRKKLGKAVNLTVAVEDSVAMQLFPHLYLPTCVWINNSKGSLIAITTKDFVTEANIKAFLESVNGSKGK